MLNNRITPFRNLQFVSLIRFCTLLVLIGGIAACGGSSGSAIEFSGSVVTADERSSSAQFREVLTGIEVCSVGLCDTTNQNGDWSFIFDKDDFVSEDFLFELRGGGIQDSVVVEDISEESEEVLITFVVNNSGQVIATTVQQVDFDDDLDDEIDEEASDIADEIDDEADETVDDIDEAIDEV